MTAKDIIEMTPRYRAENLLSLIAGRDFEQAISRIEQAFEMEREIEAKQEREACAHLVHCVAVRERERWARYKEQSCTVFSAAEELEEAIRARSEGEKKGE